MSGPRGIHERVATGVLCLAVVSVPLHRTSAAPSKPLTLEEALARASSDSLEAAVAQSRFRAAAKSVDVAEGLPNPSLSVEGGRSEPNIAGGLSMQLPFLGQRSAKIRSAEGTLAAAAAEQAATLAHIRSATRIAYFSVVRAREELSIAERDLALTSSIARAAQERFDAGSGTRLDQEQAALVVLRAQQDVLSREAERRAAELELGRMTRLGLKDLGVLANGLEETGRIPALQELLESTKTHWDVVRLERQRRAALLQADAARAERVPVPTLGAGLELLDPGTCGSMNHCVGARGTLSFDLPILNQNGGLIDEAEAQAALTDRMLEELRDQKSTQIRALYAQLLAAKKRVALYSKQYIPASDDIVEMARGGFLEGRSGLLPLLEAERSVLEARLGRTEALFEVQRARAELEEASSFVLSTP